jgi:3-polyprenyl-4-hydroxybenzoate decarboxylase
MLIKTAAKVTVSARRVLVELARHAPLATAISQILSRLPDREVVSLY